MLGTREHPPDQQSVIPLNDFRRQWKRTQAATLAAVERVGASGWLILGEEVAAFERELAGRWGLPWCVGCGSGLDAIEIALRCVGLRTGELVLTTPLSAFATTLAILRAGGTPCFVDVDESGQLDLGLAKEALEAEPRIRALLPVHLYGHALDLERLDSLRRDFEIPIVEDCAQAIGTRSRGRPVGSAGDLAATSFYPTKNLGCLGDGGAILTRVADHAALARSLRDYGQSDKYDHTYAGLNSRLDEVQAAIMREALLPELDSFTRTRVSIADRYLAEISNPHIVLPPVPDGSESTWHLFPVLVAQREAFQSHLREHGVASAVHYPKLIPDQAALSDIEGVGIFGDLSRARAFAEREVSLPIHPFLESSEIDRVIHACASWRG